MSIWILGEGRNDVGYLDNGRLRYEGDITLILVAILGSRGWRGEMFSCRREQFKESKIRIHRPGKGYGADARKIEAIIEDAHSQGCRMAICVIDVRKRDHAEKKRQFSKMEKSLESKGLDSFVIGFAVHEIEAWMLADQRSRKQAFGENERYNYASRPEDDPDPKSSLKQLFGRIEENDDLPESLMEKRRIMIKNMDPAKVKKLCPMGFDKFYKKTTNKFVPLFIKKKAG